MIKRSTLRAATMVLVLYVALLPAAQGSVQITVVLPGPVVLAGQLAGFLAVLYLLRAAMPTVQEYIQAFMDSIVEDE